MPDNSEDYKTPEERNAYRKGYADGREQTLDWLPRIMAEHEEGCNCDGCPVNRKVIAVYWERIASSPLDVDQRFWEIAKDWISIRMEDSNSD